MRQHTRSGEFPRVLPGWLLFIAAWLAVLTPPARAAEQTGQVQVRHVAPVAFLPANSEVGYAVEEGGLGRLCSSKGAGYFVAPLQFNDGTRIESITVFLEDSSPTAMGMMSLVRRRAQTFEVLATTPVSIGGAKIEPLSTEAVTAPVVDNQWWSYLLQVVLSGPGVCLHGAQVTYKSP